MLLLGLQRNRQLMFKQMISDLILQERSDLYDRILVYYVIQFYQTRNEFFVILKNTYCMFIEKKIGVTESSERG